MTEKISKTKMKQLCERIKPIVRYAEVKKKGRVSLKEDSDGDPYYIKDVDPYSVAFTWSPEPTERAYGLEPLEDIRTYHSYGYRGFFKPSISEVIKCIPENLLDDAVAFETHYAGESGDEHVARTTLYRRMNSEEVDREIEELQRIKNSLEGKLIE